MFGRRSFVSGWIVDGCGGRWEWKTLEISRCVRFGAGDLGLGSGVALWVVAGLIIFIVRVKAAIWGWMGGGW